MHRALFVSEVLVEIFTYLKPIRKQLQDFTAPDEITLAQKSIESLVRTCKTFYEPAMDLLWADMYDFGIIPLLGCVTRLNSLVYCHAEALRHKVGARQSRFNFFSSVRLTGLLDAGLLCWKYRTVI
jgi:hypothetical protein